MIEIISTRFMEHIFFDSDMGGAQTKYLHNGHKKWLITYMTRELYEDYRDGKLDFDAYVMNEIERQIKDRRWSWLRNIVLWPRRQIASIRTACQFFVVWWQG